MISAKHSYPHTLTVSRPAPNRNHTKPARCTLDSLHGKLSIMKEIKPGPGFTIFVLFFGLALLDAIQIRNWLQVGFWLLIGLIFLLAESRGKQKKTE